MMAFARNTPLIPCIYLGGQNGPWCIYDGDGAAPRVRPGVYDRQHVSFQAALNEIGGWDNGVVVYIDHQVFDVGRRRGI
jgi:hypothetical protein